VLVLTVGLAQAQSLQSASVLEFAGADTLFVADSIAGAIHAVEVPDIGGAPTEATPYNLLGLDGLLAEALGADPRGFTYHDLAVHPVTRDAWISLTATFNGSALPAVVTA